MSGAYEYEGGELELFRHARNWKAYWISRIAGHLRGDVAEVGAGIGANTEALRQPGVRSWTCVEPDGAQAARLKAAVGHLPATSVVTGTVADLPEGSFDAVLYADVLEHVADDRSETARAALRLRTGGRLVVVGPAHQELFSPFDAAIGHHRRYDAESLRACRPESCREVALEYLDSAGMLASLANRLLLKQSLPTLSQIRTWDRLIVPVSRVLDPLLLRRVGKSILVAWEKA